MSYRAVILLLALSIIVLGSGLVAVVTAAASWLAGATMTQAASRAGAVFAGCFTLALMSVTLLLAA